MYFIIEIIILNIRLSISGTIIEEKRNNLEKCMEIQKKYNPEASNVYKYNFISHDISSVILNSVLEKMQFPLEILESTENSNETKYVIVKKDLTLGIYYYGLIKGIDLSTIYDMERKYILVNKLMKDIISQTILLYQTLLCIRFNAGFLDLRKTKLIIDKYVDVKVDTKKIVIEHVFIEGGLKYIIDDIYKNISFREINTSIMEEKHKGEEQEKINKFVNESVSGLKDVINKHQQASPNLDENLMNSCMTMNYNSVTASMLSFIPLFAIRQ
ncbi:putative SP-containing protein [Vairimorpha necatrix]|uniref:SP-containing protein n=1 Tax=Vairimorpha necatrix TaxID=6039 RepID=A0AAX4JDA0_9MICR